MIVVPRATPVTTSLNVTETSTMVVPSSSAAVGKVSETITGAVVCALPPAPPAPLVLLLLELAVWPPVPVVVPVGEPLQAATDANASDATQPEMSEDRSMGPSG